jgi:hypothetical protein
MRKIIALLALGISFSPALALTCDELVTKEAIAYTLKSSKEKWHGNTATAIRFNDAEKSAKAWVKESEKGKEVVQRAKDTRRAGCTP